MLDFRGMSLMVFRGPPGMELLLLLHHLPQDLASQKLDEQYQNQTSGFKEASFSLFVASRSFCWPQMLP